MISVKRRKLTCFILMIILFDTLLFVLNRYRANSSYSEQLNVLDHLKPNKSQITCELIFESNKNEIKKAETHLKQINNRPSIDDSKYIFDSAFCKQFRFARGYDTYPVRDSELEFPLAFTILSHENVEQVERLLKLIYRPHNVYCIHIDTNSPTDFHRAIQSITQCFDNVFIATKLEKIVYAGISRLRADLNCMNDLVESKYVLFYPTKRSVKWKYYLNLASTEFPLRTNYELTRILRLFNGANDIEMMRNVIETRVHYKWQEVFDENSNKLELAPTGQRKPPPPHNFTIVKGLAYGVFSYSFVDYILNNQYAKDLLNWMTDIYSPDEVYWATLQYNTQFNPPGGYKSDWTGPKRVNTTSRFVIWGDNIHCMGTWIHGVCVFSFRDLPVIIKRHELFANKFYLAYNRIAYECMEEWLLNKIMSVEMIRILDYCSHPAIRFYNKQSYCDVNLITY